MLTFQNRDLVVSIEIREGRVATSESEAASAARHGNVAKVGGRKVECGPLKAQSAVE